MENVINTKKGKISGIVQNGCRKYLGIPFAMPPVGEHSFCHPQKPEAWDGVLQANKGQKNPIQESGGWGCGNNDQDCLYMNIFAPENAKESLPVMVWIYGGSYAVGGTGRADEGSDELVYELSRFACETNTVVVEFNYRLNLYGFLNLRYLNENFEQNCGLYDQTMALQFIHENISAFGGNPDNVTLFGQSAGGACILALMSMPEAIPLFHKAIVQSACIDHFRTEEESRKLTKRYLKYVGINEKEIETLRNMEPKRIRDANKKLAKYLLMHGDVRCAFSPIVDGVTLRQFPRISVKNSEKPLLIGCVSQEGNAFVNNAPEIMMPLINSHFKLHVGCSIKGMKQSVADAFTEQIYRAPLHEIAAEMKGKVWIYEYCYVTPDLQKNGVGCCHASELPVLFSEKSWMTEEVNDSETERVGIEMRKIWGDFAHTGVVNWSEFSTSSLVKNIE